MVSVNNNVWRKRRHNSPATGGRMATRGVKAKMALIWHIFNFYINFYFHMITFKS